MKNSRFLSVLFFVLLAVAMIGICPMQAQSSENSSSNMDALIEALYNDGAISSKNGQQTIIGDYEDSWAQMGIYKVQELLNAERFVFSADVSGDSASDKPNNFEAGCGVMFNASRQKADQNHLLASIRMDGLFYFSGVRAGQMNIAGTYKYDKPSIRGSKNFVLVVDHDKATVYLDQQRLVSKVDLNVFGDVVGVVTLSGTNKGFGTRCTYKNLSFYTW